MLKRPDGFIPRGGSLFCRSGCLFVLAVLLVATGCGLETFYYLDPPLGDAVVENASDPDGRVLRFRAASNSGSSDIFMGTAVYYRLYDSSSTMNSNRTAIENRNEEYSDAAMSYMVSNGFQPIALGDSELVVQKDGGAASVEIRLFDEGSYYAEVRVDGVSRGEPLRMPLRKGFSFYPVQEDRQGDYPVPKEGDSDVYYSGSGGGDWYVLAYAVSVGRSMELTPVYSQVTPLGWLSVSPD